ncbi:MAG: hypothetical protein KC414_09125 [Romboutsia sp.]|nr:hypothetical protein [Romboutsia sp.]
MLNELIEKMNKLSYIYFSFYKIENKYQCIIYTTDEVKHSSGEIDINKHYNNIYVESGLYLTKEEAAKELSDEINFLYNEYSLYNEKERLEDDKSILSKYLISPYHAVILSKEQYLYFLKKYQEDINIISSYTKTTQNVRDRLKYAKKIVNRKNNKVDFTNLFYFRNFETLKTTEFGNFLVGLSFSPITLDDLIADCNEKFMSLQFNKSGYINQWILRSYESCLCLPKKWAFDERNFIYPTSKDNTSLKQVNYSDIICLNTNVNKEF